MRTRRTTNRSLIRRVVARIFEDRHVLGLRVGLNALAGDAATGMLARHRCDVAHVLLPFAFEITPRPGPRCCLSLSLFNPPIGNRYAQHYAWSVAHWGDISVDDAEHDLYGVCCALDQSLREDTEAFAAAVEGLRRLPGVWTGRPFDELIEAARSVWRCTDEDRSPRKPTTAEARELYERGHEACRRAEYTLAGAALEAAISKATTLEDWDIVVLSHIALATSAAERGNTRIARSHHRRAHSVARRHSRSLLGHVLHEMYWLAADVGEQERAVALAASARLAYGAENPGLMRLAHDVGFNWIAWGAPERGVPLVRLTCHLAATFEEALCSWGGIARGAGAMRDDALLEFAVGRIAHLQDSCSTERHRADALLNAARGLASAGRWVEAEEHCSAALEVAARRREGRQIFEAEAVLCSIRTHTRLEMGVAWRESQAEALADALLRDISEGPLRTLPI